MSIQSYSSATAESPVSQAVRETRRQGTRMQEGEQVRASLPALMESYRGIGIVGRVCMLYEGDLVVFLLRSTAVASLNVI